MSDEQNIPEEEPIDNSQQPTEESSQSQTSNPKLEIVNMEVHKHPHHVTHKKKWGEYLLEFLMLFLAVFLGFVAENIREHYVENKRAGEYADRLVADLKKDTAWFNNENRRLVQRQPSFDTLISLLIQPVSASDAQVLQKLLHINYVSDAKMNTATYNQMKASGSLRYISNLELTNSLQEYYEVQLPGAVESSEGIRTFFNDYIKTFFIDHLRNQDMQPSVDTMKNGNPVIIGRNSETDQRLSNIISMDRTQLDIANRFYKSANKKAVELIVLIKKEYHLENE